MIPNLPALRRLYFIILITLNFIFLDTDYAEKINAVTAMKFQQYA